VILAFAGTAVSLFGYANNPIILAALVLVMMAELFILIASRTKLVCYRCRSRYTNTQIARYHLPFNQQVAELAINQADQDVETWQEGSPTSEPDQVHSSESRRERLSRLRIEHAKEDQQEQARLQESKSADSKDSTPGCPDDDAGSQSHDSKGGNSPTGE
jgi:hypothetical protein